MYGLYCALACLATYMIAKRNLRWYNPQKKKR